ncbi:Sporulation kinase E [Roseimaritima multifibrata]|uniref:histidine kinase n=1 Tax=Roseimaritima multifibrata TaxID=1930274 RepID=A0A517MNV9_9BACT|nr:ATP-binding protein [Roseimaritima multifibrata]QDS96565.1 Sporulation kinase E [Roseimaritima multifibrata]
MFDVQNGRKQRGRWLAAALTVLSLTSLGGTIWIIHDVQRDQQIVRQIVSHLPESDLEAVEELADDLELDNALVVLLGLNIIGTAIASALLLRGYFSSQQSLRDVKVLATDILASMDAGVLTTDLHGRITSMNPSGQNLIGKTPVGDTMFGRTLVDSLDRGQELRLSEIGEEHQLLNSICEEVLRTDKVIRDRDYCVNDNGYERTLRAGCSLLQNHRQEKLGTVVHVRDVTERARIEERLRRMERYMGLGSLAAGLQHEIKNPLSALSLHVQLLQERLEGEGADEDVTEMLDILSTEVQRITAVVDGFRSYASMSQLGRSPADVTMLIERLVRLLRPQAAQQNIKLNVELPQELLGLIEIDTVRLEQVFLNLALNAMAAMPSGGRLLFRLRREDDWVRVDVVDTGAGIPDEIHDQIFDPYFTTRNDGTGMGLALCDKIVRQHDGHLHFQSSSEGTEFSVFLPTGATA